MCTLILQHRPDHAWPMLLAANRDERLDRPWQAPAAHWPDQPGVIGGLDVLAGGTWLAFNQAGLVAAVLNRTGTLGPLAGKDSRGDLPLLALRHDTAAEAAQALAGLDGGRWRSFNLVLADRQTAFFVRGLGAGPVTVTRLPAGVTMVTAADPNDLSHPRVARHLPRFQQAVPPTPPEWASWPALLADSEGPLDAALNLPETQGFGTASAMLIAAGTSGLCWRFWQVAGAAPSASLVPFPSSPPLL